VYSTICISVLQFLFLEVIHQADNSDPLWEAGQGSENHDWEGGLCTVFSLALLHSVSSACHLIKNKLPGLGRWGAGSLAGEYMLSHMRDSGFNPQRKKGREAERKNYLPKNPHKSLKLEARFYKTTIRLRYELWSCFRPGPMAHP
jgi:hypothetical protein